MPVSSLHPDILGVIFLSLTASASNNVQRSLLWAKSNVIKYIFRGFLTFLMKEHAEEVPFVLLFAGIFI
jgi:hypothetical protein